MEQINVLPPQELLRRAVIEVASLPERDLVVVLEIVADLKQTKAARRAQAAELVARARKRAEELKDMPREQVFAQFRAAIESIRAGVIAKGTAIEGDWEGD